MTNHPSNLKDITFSNEIVPVRHDGCYEGQFLIATPAMSGELFSRGVVYVFGHHAGGAMGILLNKPLDTIHYATLFQQLGLEVGRQNRDMTVYHGGPVQENRGFVVHSNDYATDDTISHECGISVTSSMNILRDLGRGRGPMRAVLSVGYAAWAAGQLEAEIESNFWLTVPATPAVAFDAENEAKYALAAKTIGIDMVRFSPVAGHA
jgi:putative transcriptional regulator